MASRRPKGRNSPAAADAYGFSDPYGQPGYYAGGYDPYSGPVELFEDPSTTGYPPTSSPSLFTPPTSGPYAAQAPTGNYFAPNQPGFAYNQGPGPQGFDGSGFAGINPNMLMSGAQQFIQGPMAPLATQVVGQYSNEVLTKSKTWIGQNVKYYFAVDTSYVLKKLLILFFPFTHKDWSLRYSQESPIAPKDDLNAPDLYIPSMAIVTYILLSGYLLGVQNKFTPETIGMYASSSLALLLLEVSLIMMSLYLLDLSKIFGFLHLVAYCSYKYVCVIAALLASTILGSMGFYAILGYGSFSLGFFLLRSLYVQTQTVASSAKTGLYLVLAIVLVQPLLMYWLSRNLIVAQGTVST